jgi:hypothetical protein
VKMLGLHVYKNVGSQSIEKYWVSKYIRMLSLIEQDSAEYDVQMLGLQVYKNVGSPSI